MTNPGVVGGTMSGTSLILGLTATQLQGIAAGVTALISIALGIAFLMYYFKKNKREKIELNEALKAERAKSSYYEEAKKKL